MVWGLVDITVNKIKSFPRADVLAEERCTNIDTSGGKEKVLQRM